MNWARNIRTSALVLAVAGMAGSQLAFQEAPPVLDAVRARGELVVAVRPGPTSHYQTAWGDAGFEFELAQGFARDLGVQLRVIPAATADEALALVADGAADFALDMAMTPRREESFRFGLPVQAASAHVVCGNGRPSPASVADLDGRPLAVMAGSHHVEQLAPLRRAQPGLGWLAVPDATEAGLLAMVHEGTVDCTLVDSDSWEFHRHLFPALRVAFDLPEPLYLAWAFPQADDDSLRLSANGWLARRHADGFVQKLHDRYAAHVRTLTDIDAQKFYERLQQRLPRYLALFQEEAARNDLDWRLLAAVAYQESMWDPSALSPTGVRGLMQLTQATASQLGVADREDPAASIRGGARYLRQLIDSLPADIPDPDRTWMALAAYNAGVAHLHDARVIAQRRGGDPDSWPDVRAALPLLKQEQWYTQARHGYAQGATQAVVYVRHVRRYYDLMVLASNSRHHNELMLAQAGRHVAPAWN